MLTSSRYHVSRVELETQWSFEDLCVAHDVIDLLEEAEAEGMRRARAESDGARRPR